MSQFSRSVKLNLFRKARQLRPKNKTLIKTQLYNWWAHCVDKLYIVE